jgi:hypothetical protein
VTQPGATNWAQGWADVVTAALGTPGGAELVLHALSGVPQVNEVEVKTGWRSTVPAVAVGDRRFRAQGDSQLLVEHVVQDVVLSTSTAGPADAGLAVSAALTAHVRHFGATLVPEVEAALEGLRRSLWA